MSRREIELSDLFSSSFITSLSVAKQRVWTFYQDEGAEDRTENTVIHSLTPRKMSLIIQTGGETVKAERVRP